MSLAIVAIYACTITVAGMVGFGGMLLFFALAVFVEPNLKSLLFLASFGGCIKSMYSGYLFRAHIDWPLVWHTLAWGAPFVVLGGVLVHSISPDIMKFLLGVFMLLFVAWKALGTVPDDWQLPLWARRAWAAAWGFTGGLIGAAGPVLVSYLQTLRLPKQAFVAVIQMLFIGSTGLKLFLYYPIPSTYNTAPSLLIVALLALVGAAVGKWLHDRVSEVFFSRLVLVLLLASGVRMIVSAL